MARSFRLVAGSPGCYVSGMSSERLMTSWSEYDGAIGEVLSIAGHSLAVFDHDLVSLKLETPERHEALAAFLRRPQAQLRIAVQSSRPVLQHSPRLIALLRLHAHNFQLIETPPHLAGLSDSLLLADGETAVVRFHRDHARSKVIVGDAEACKPYGKRFEEIWNEGGTPLSATTLGL
ncbi:MAG TPA: hypothetical protein VFY24_16440 [Azospira sp.]|nr:hypothetical protein [Azospira sp.]